MHDQRGRLLYDELRRIALIYLLGPEILTPKLKKQPRYKIINLFTLNINSSTLETV